MAAWRTKAYTMFQLNPGDYSYREGKRGLFTNLVDWARQAIDEKNSIQLNKIVEYVIWAEQQNSYELNSSIDLCFFLPVLKDTTLSESILQHFPAELIARVQDRIFDNELH